MDWLNNVWELGKKAAADFAGNALGLAKDAPKPQAETKGADTTARNAQQAMPQWLWLVLAGLGLVALLAFRRR